jgi:hypothetical protein
MNEIIVKNLTKKFKRECLLFISEEELNKRLKSKREEIWNNENG